jgi:hypothetical protein
MKKIMIAALGLSLLSGTVVFAQNTATTDTTAKKGKHKKAKKSSTADTTNTASK